MLPTHPPRQPDESEEVILAEIDEQPNLAANQSSHSNRSFIEQLLSPQSLQWMMACGSGILILGFVIWLWSVGVFENPLVVASCAGAATLGLIAGGTLMVRKTCYQLGGRWLTLLGALAMPLNLWLYDAQGLITLSDGGHLWIPAAICCVIYAGIARVLRDATFVYTLVGGIVLTGMLFLADQSIGRFFHWLPPTKFLLTIGWISVFAERLFASGKSDFSRENFGVAFYRAGILVVTSGLAILLGGFFSAIGSSILSTVEFWPLTTITDSAKIWALGLVSVSAAGFFAQGYLRTSKWHYGIGVSLIAWAGLIAMNVCGITLTFTSIAIFAGALLTASNSLQVLTRNRSETQQTVGHSVLGLIGSQFAVGALSVLAAAQILFSTLTPVDTLIPISWWTVLQFALTTSAAWSLAWNIGTGNEQSKSSAEFVGGFLSFGGIVAMLAGWVAVSLSTIVDSQFGVLLLAAAPLLVVIAAIFLPTGQRKLSLGTVASSMTSTHLVMLGVTATNLHLTWAICLGLAAATYFAVSWIGSKTVNQILSLLSITASIAVLGNYAGFDFGHCLILAPMIAGTIIKIACYLAAMNDQQQTAKKKFSVELGANLIVFQAGIASVLFAMSRWLDGQTGQSLMVVMASTLACTVLVSFLTKDAAWRTAFRTLIIAIVGSCLCVFDGFLNLDGWHRGEIISIAGGIMLLVLGHAAWMRESEGEEDDTATISLILGGLMVAIPLGLGLLICRLQESPEGYWRLFHEIMAITCGLIMLGSGLLCRIRSTTIAGGLLLAFFVGSLAVLVRWPSQLQNVSVVMMVGGGVFFAVAVLMSIYRDRLISLPTRIRKGEGVYQVLKWR